MNDNKLYDKLPPQYVVPDEKHTPTAFTKIAEAAVTTVDNSNDTVSLSTVSAAQIKGDAIANSIAKKNNRLI